MGIGGIEPVGGSASSRRHLDPRAAQASVIPAPGRMRESGADESQFGAAPAEKKDKPRVDPAATSREVTVEPQPEGGARVTVYDVRTGQPVYQVPPDQVVRVIEAAIERLRTRGDHRGHR